jgi:DNA repair protein RadC
MHTLQQPLLSIAELTLTYQYTLPPAERLFVKSSIEAAEIFRPYFDDCIEFKEHAYVMLLNQAQHVIAIYKLSEGALAATLIDVRLLFCAALKSLASKIILCHNHPSGSLHPSKQDIEFTRKVKEGAKLLEMDVVDHIIVTREGHYSLADNGDFV